MFLHLTDFGYKRDALGALGFYVTYFAFILIAGLMIGMALNMLMPNYSIQEGMVFSKAFAMLSCLTLSLLILQSKNLNSSIPFILLALLSTVLAGLGGASLGLLVPTFFSIYGGTKKSVATKKRKRK